MRIEIIFHAPLAIQVKPNNSNLKNKNKIKGRAVENEIQFSMIFAHKTRINVNFRVH